MKKQLSEEHKRKLSLSKMGNKNCLGHHQSEEHKDHISKSLLGKKANLETRKKISQSKMGDKNPMYGKHFSEEAKRKRHESIRDKNNPRWKGGKIGYYLRRARIIWENFWNDDIKPNHDIHHLDGNYRNNNISNLTMLPHGKHIKLHHQKRKGLCINS